MKDDNVGSSLMFLGTIFHNLGPVYLIECLPYVAVLNLGMTNSLLRKAYFVSDLRNRSAIYGIRDLAPLNLGCNLNVHVPLSPVYF